MCNHPGFVFECKVSHLTDTGGKVLDLSGSCSACGLPVAFLRLDILEQGGECRVELPDGEEDSL